MGRVTTAQLRPADRVASIDRAGSSIRPVNAAELLAALASLDGARDAGGTDVVTASCLVSGIEYAVTEAESERGLRARWRRRVAGRPTPLVLLVDDPDVAGGLQVLGPLPDEPLRRIRAEALRDAVARTTVMKRLEARRHVAQEVDRLDSGGVAGVVVRGLGTEHLFKERLPHQPVWEQLAAAAAGTAGADWRTLLTRLGYEVTQTPTGYGAVHGGRTVMVVHPRQSPGQFARLDADGRLPEGALLADCRERGADWGLLAAGTRLRLLATATGEAGVAARYLDLDTAGLDDATRPLVGLLAPASLAEGGMAAILADARDHGQALRRRLDRMLRESVLPILGVELGRWARTEGRDLTRDEVRADLEAATLTFVFRALFLLYAESAGHLPMQNQTYRDRSMTAICRRAAEELDVADTQSTSLWRDVEGLVEAMRSGQSAWGVPAYNGDLFSIDGFAGADTLARARIGDAALAPALVALARDADDPAALGVDFSGLEIGHLGHIYEGLLSLRLSLADRDYAYDARADRYVPADPGDGDVAAGDLLWLTDEGGRKGGGVYYTRTDLVRHLVRGAVGPAFDRHLDEVRELAATDPVAAAQALFDFHVLDPACGSAHFLVEVLDELADKVAAFIGHVALPDVRTALDDLRRGVAAAFAGVVEDTVLLRRLILKRCVYGVDLSPMGAEIAKVSLWLASFVPGLSLAYLDGNVQVGNSLVGVARADAVSRSNGAQGSLFDDPIRDAVDAAAQSAAVLRSIEDRTPDEVAASRRAHDELRRDVIGARRLFDLWTADGFGLAGARAEVQLHGRSIIDGQASLLDDGAAELAAEQRFLHWPLAFAQVFARPNPGFDAIVGNPPWDEITVEELAFYARYRPGLRALDETTRSQVVQDLLSERPELAGRLSDEQGRVAEQRAYFGASADYEGGGGDPDSYRFFCQRYRDLLRDRGTLGVVLPRTAFSAKGSEGFRRWLFEHASPRRIDFITNTARWAFDMEPRYTVALLVAERHTPQDDAVVEVAGVADSVVSFMGQIGVPGLLLGHAAFGPVLEVPLLADQAAADVLTKLRLGEPFPRGAGRWLCFPVREFDEALDKRLWKDATEGRPLWKGASFNQFDPHGREARPCPESPEALAKARKPRPGAQSLIASDTSVKQRRAAVVRTVDRARVAFRDIGRADDSRTARACLVPPGVFLTNTAPYLAFVDDEPLAEAACLGVLNSAAFDWQARRFVELHMNFFILDGFRVPRLDDDTFTAIARAAARLSCADERFADFAAATGVEVGPLSDDERDRLRADIDARVARAWNLTADELDVVFSDFTLDAVPEAYRRRVRKRFAELT